MVIKVKFFQTELIVEIYFKSLVGAFAQQNLGRTPIKIHKGDEK